MGNVQIPVPPTRRRKHQPPQFLCSCHLWTLGSDCGRARPACPGLSAVPAQGEKGRGMDRGRRCRAPGAELAGGADLPANAIDGWKVISEKSTAWVVKTRRQPGDGFRAAVHAPGLRLPLGRGQGRISLSLPHFAVLDRRQGAGRAGAAAAGPVRNQARTATSCCSANCRDRRRRSRETPHTRASTTGWTTAPASRPRCGNSSTKRFRPRAAGTRCSAASRCSCSWCRHSPARCWPSTTRPRRAMRTTACATS